MVANLTDLASTAMTVEYFSQEGYYAKNDPRQRRASFWHGAAAAALGMAKHVSPRAFERILSGHVPGTDIRLGRVRDGEHQHRPGFDLTLSAPKTVSLEALLYGDRRVLGAHDAAVKATLDWLERDLLQTRSWDPVTRQRPRVAANGLVVAGLVAAGFRHLTSRDQDPQLHTHCILANMTRNRAGEWRSVEPTEMRRNVRLIGAVYRQELAQRLLALGFRIEATMIGGVPGFEIAGYGRGFVDAFSSRRREILAWLDEHGLPWSAALTQQAALITRKKKTDRDVDELRADWKARAERLGLSRDRSIAKPGLRRTTTVSRKTARKAGRPYVRTAEELRPEPPGLSAREVTWRAVEHLAERASVIREREIGAIALGHAPGRHGLADIDAAVAGLIGDGHLVEAEVRGGLAGGGQDAGRDRPGTPGGRRPGYRREDRRRAPAPGAQPGRRRGGAVPGGRGAPRDGGADSRRRSPRSGRRRGAGGMGAAAPGSRDAAERSPGGRGLARGGRGTRARFRDGSPGNGADARRQEGRTTNRGVPGGLRRSPVRGRSRRCGPVGRRGGTGPLGRTGRVASRTRAQNARRRPGREARRSAPRPPCARRGRARTGFARRSTGLRRRRCNAVRRGSLPSSE